MKKAQKVNIRGGFKWWKQQFNHLIDEVRALRIANGVGYSVDPTAVGQKLRISSQSTVSTSQPKIEAFRIATFYDDHFECLKVDSDGVAIANTETSILKPTKLRSPELPATVVSQAVDPDVESRQRWTYSYNHDFGGTIGEKEIEEVQVVQPLYEDAQLIYAIQRRAEIRLDHNNLAITWTDLNIDGRHWVIDPQDYGVCVDVGGTPTTQHARFKASKSA